MKSKKLHIGLLTLLILTLFLSTSVLAATVCRIGNKKYDNLQKALDAVRNGQTITMTKAVTTEDCYGIGRKVNFTIDFAGKKYTGTYDKAPTFFFEQTGKVTLKNLNLNANGFQIGEKATVVIAGGKYTGRGIISNNGTLQINKGTFTRKNGAEPVQFIWTGKKGVTRIKGGTFKGTKDTTSTVGFLTNSGTLTISGGTFKTYAQNIIDNYGKVTITKGTFSAGGRADNRCIFNRQNTTLTIKGGTFIASDNVIHSAVINPNQNGRGATKISISGGTFKNSGSVPAFVAEGNQTTVTISGGAFKGGPMIWRGGAVCTLKGGSSDRGVIASDGARITIKKFTIRQGTPAKDPSGNILPLLEANHSGSIIVKGGSFVSKKGLGYNGDVKFGIKNWKKLFQVKQLTRQ